MPTEAGFEGLKHLPRHRCEPRLRFIFVANILVDDIGKDMRLPNLDCLEQPADQSLHHFLGVTGGDWTTRLRLRLIEAALDHRILPRVLSVQHHPELAVRPDNLPDLLDDSALIGSVMNNSKRIDQIK